MGAYYNEIDPYCAAWLRNLIAAGHLPAGDVDERSIVEVKPDDVRNYTQAHFFAGIGGWPYALRLAGWPDDRAVWTGSCPCQPLSSAGQHKGHTDERHLWPAFYALIAECCPPTLFGEQVANQDGREWLAAVRSDLEASRYAIGAADLPTAGIGAPHRRQRLFFVAHADQSERGRITDGEGGHRYRTAARRIKGDCELQPGSAGISMANAKTVGWPGEHLRGDREPQERTAEVSELGGMDDAASARHERKVEEPESDPRNEARLRLSGEGRGQDRHGQPGPTNGFWGDADWLLCRDGKWRPVEPGTFPLAHGIPARVGKLRAYGNAIEPHVAAAFVRASP